MIALHVVWFDRGLIRIGARDAAVQQVCGRSEAGGGRPQEPAPHLPGDRGRGERRPNPGAVRRLEGRLRLLVSLRLARYLSGRLVRKEQLPHAAAWSQRYDALLCVLSLQAEF